MRRVINISVLLLTLASLTVLAGTGPAAASTRTVSSSFSYTKGALTSAGVTCDHSLFYVCGIGTFDGKPALSLVHYPSTEPVFDGGSCVLYVVDETITLTDQPGSLELRHDLTLCPPSLGWFKNQGGGSNGNPFHFSSTWTVVAGSGAFAQTTGQGTWTAFVAGNAGSGQHTGTLSSP